MMWKALLLVAALTGCGLTTEGDMWRAALVEKAAAVADQKLRTDIWGVCEGNSIGAIDRYFGRSQELADSWRKLCHGQDGVDLIGPAE